MTVLCAGATISQVHTKHFSKQSKEQKKTAHPVGSSSGVLKDKIHSYKSEYTILLLSKMNVQGHNAIHVTYHNRQTAEFTQMSVKCYNVTATTTVSRYKVDDVASTTDTLIDVVAESITFKFF